MACEVSKAAYERGYGTRDEIVAVEREPQSASSHRNSVSLPNYSEDRLTDSDAGGLGT